MNNKQKDKIQINNSVELWRKRKRSLKLLKRVVKVKVIMKLRQQPNHRNLHSSIAWKISQHFSWHQPMLVVHNRSSTGTSKWIRHLISHNKARRCNNNKLSQDRHHQDNKRLQLEHIRELPWPRCKIIIKHHHQLVAEINKLGVVLCTKCKVISRGVLLRSKWPANLVLVFNRRHN